MIHSGAVLCVRWANGEGRFLASGSDDTKIIIWELSGYVFCVQFYLTASHSQFTVPVQKRRLVTWMEPRIRKSIGL